MTYKHMTIDNLATALEACSTGAIVVADGTPMGFESGSYRGYSERLRIGFADNPGVAWGDATITAIELSQRLRRTVGKHLAGYKGGKFLMTNDTLVHCAEYGCEGPMIIGVIEHKDSNTVELVLCEERTMTGHRVF